MCEFTVAFEQQHKIALVSLFQESDVSISKTLQRVDGLYQLEAEVTVIFSDFKKCQAVSNFLVEKMDESVKISLPEFYQSPQRLENLR